jgi:hypothetical protein
MPPEGIIPLKSLNERFRYDSVRLLLRLGGILPDKWLSETSKDTRFFSSPMESGRFPSKAL